MTDSKEKPPVLTDNVITWAGRLDIVAEVLRRRAENVIIESAAETVASIAAEMKLAAAHVSTWPAPALAPVVDPDEPPPSSRRR